MFGLFKKKVINYLCIGMIKPESISNNDIEILLNLFDKKLNERVFTEAEIENMSVRLEGNVRESYFFIDSDRWNSIKKKIEILVLYRFLGSKNLSGDEIENMILEINSDIFYNRTEIEKLSEKVGFSVWDRCLFEPYIINSYILDDSKEIIDIVVSKGNL